MAPKILLENQRGFVRGMQITDCICIASEAINMLENKSFRGNLAIKLDIRKAFDTIDWKFLLKVLQAFGFDPIFCNWINVIIHSVKVSFLVNGKPIGVFNCKRGVRQEDPLSPLLSSLAEDVLSKGISHLVHQGLLSPMSRPRGFQIPSHVLYADDVLIFYKGTRANLLNLINLFEENGDVSGQIINPEKSKFYPGNISSARVSSISATLGFATGKLPFVYLGVPIFKVKPKKCHLQPIADKVKAKLSS